ncbi:hypothetical protein [Nonomuraea sp. NPDC050310]|uniref:hypothetical protein n=1 Tax=Nonomuraea sp. NPDC050310 TaxID=3154935 RepID=UPI0033CAA706
MVIERVKTLLAVVILVAVGAPAEYVKFEYAWRMVDGMAASHASHGELGSATVVRWAGYRSKYCLARFGRTGAEVVVHLTGECVRGAVHQVRVVRTRNTDISFIGPAEADQAYEAGSLDWLMYLLPVVLIGLLALLTLGGAVGGVVGLVRGRAWGAARVG